jgi:hypothetical protein
MEDFKNFFIGAAGAMLLPSLFVIITIILSKL